MRELSPAWRWRLGVTLGLGLALTAVEKAKPLRRLEWLSEDWRLQARAWWQKPTVTGEVVLVAVDELSLKSGGGSWPFARTIHGQLLDWLGRDEASRPAVLAWDFGFTEDSFDPEVDAMFTEPLRAGRYPVVMGVFSDPAATGLLSSGKAARTLGATQPIPVPSEVRARLPDQRGAILPIAGVIKGAKFAFLDAQADEDGVVRKLPLVVRVGERVFPGLVLQTLLAYWRATPEQVELRLGEALIVRPAGKPEQRIPMDELGRYAVNYRYSLAGGSSRAGIPALSYMGDERIHRGLHDTLLQRVEFGENIPPLNTKGNILVVGEVATGLTDIGPSPLAGEAPKVLYHLNALENILSRDFLRRAPVWPGVWVMLAAGLGLAALLGRRGFGLYVICTPLLILAMAGMALMFLFTRNLMLPLALPLAGLALQQAAITTLKIREEQAQRERIRRMFGSYVSPELVRRMVEARAEPQLGGHEDEITAFFSDIQGFSSFSEVLTPVDLVELLNEYLGGMTDILQEQGGALDKYIGDAMVAMFGGLVPLPDHARRACETAVRMQMKQAELRAHWQSQGNRWPALVQAMRTRIGLNSGRVVVGNMGSKHRFNYTMMGDVVNLAARCESGAKSFGVYTLVTEETVKRAQADGCACVFRALDRIVVKGKTLPVEVYELTALSPEHLPEGGAQCLGLFARGRAHYLKQEWAEAIRCFDEAAPLEPLQPERDAGVENNPSLLMRARCETLQAHPPGAEWDGVYRMTSK